MALGKMFFSLNYFFKSLYFFIVLVQTKFKNIILIYFKN